MRRILMKVFDCALEGNLYAIFGLTALCTYVAAELVCNINKGKDENGEPEGEA